MSWLPLSAQSATTMPAVPGVEAAGAPEAQIPSAADLDTWKWEQHRLESDLAASLGFSVGSAKGNRNSRTLIAEFSRSKTVDANGKSARYGVAARLVVNVIGYEADANLTFPFVAAQAEFNRLEAYANLTVEGYVGKGTGDLLPEFTAFDVESYVKLMDAMTAMKNRIGEDEANIRPLCLWAWSTETSDDVEARLTRAVGSAWALTGIADGRSLEHSISKYRDQGDHLARTAIEDVYGQLGVGGRDVDPTGESRERARRLLDGYEMKHPLLG